MQKKIVKKYAEATLQEFCRFWKLFFWKYWTRL